MKLAFTSALMALSTGAAVAQGCGDYGEIRDKLRSEYGEAVVGVGMSPSGQSFVQIWSNPDTGTWTALRVYVDGNACMLSAGTDWVDVLAPPGGDPA